jgi:hypothetical protein
MDDPNSYWIIKPAHGEQCPQGTPVRNGQVPSSTLPHHHHHHHHHFPPAPILPRLPMRTWPLRKAAALADSDSVAAAAAAATAADAEFSARCTNTRGVGSRRSPPALSAYSYRWAHPALTLVLARRCGEALPPSSPFPTPCSSRTPPPLSTALSAASVPALGPLPARQIIRLTHLQTKRNLHSHRVDSPLSKQARGARAGGGGAVRD